MMASVEIERVYNLLQNGLENGSLDRTKKEELCRIITNDYFRSYAVVVGSNSNKLDPDLRDLLAMGVNQKWAAKQILREQGGFGIAVIRHLRMVIIYKTLRLWLSRAAVVSVTTTAFWLHMPDWRAIAVFGITVLCIKALFLIKE